MLGVWLTRIQIDIAGVYLYDFVHACTVHNFQFDAANLRSVMRLDGTSDRPATVLSNVQRNRRKQHRPTSLTARSYGEQKTIVTVTKVSPALASQPHDSCSTYLHLGLVVVERGLLDLDRFRRVAGCLGVLVVCGSGYRLHLQSGQGQREALLRRWCRERLRA